jgi:putative phosphoribosyl transferase
MFADRQDAGRRLAERLVHVRDGRPVVLGLPRGGVPVAAVVAESLHAPLDVLVVRKIGAPHQPELAMGAVTNGANPMYVLNEDVVRMLGVTNQFLEGAIARELDEVKRRQNLYRSGRPPIDIAGDTAIVIDDGIATGATVRAGLRSLRARSPHKLVLAVPVAPPESIEMLSREVDDLVCLHAPDDFYAVGQFYHNFEQTTDEQVIRALDDAARRMENNRNI